jgi:hypothetical protein
VHRIEPVFEEAYERSIAYAVSQCQPWHKILVDCRFDHRRNASQGCFSAIDRDTGLVVFQELIDKKRRGDEGKAPRHSLGRRRLIWDKGKSAAAMEQQCLEDLVVEVATWPRANQPVYFTSDKCSTAGSAFRNAGITIIHTYDPGHCVHYFNKETKAVGARADRKMRRPGGKGRAVNAVTLRLSSVLAYRFSSRWDLVAAIMSRLSWREETGETSLLSP